MVISIFKKIIIPVLLFHILSIAFFLTADLSRNSVFQTPIRYAADDGIYHMRLVENMLLGNHFPKRIYFDPFTFFPFGTYIHFAPLYDFLIALAIWIFGLGHPTLELINKIAPFYPPVLGCLTILIIFFIGKVLWNKWAGLFSAFLMAVSGPFLFRSLLGATDHHQAEVLFSTLAILFLILAFKSHGKKNFWLWTILASIGLGLYFLTWIGALLFLFIIFVSIIFYYLIEYLSGRSQNWILISGSIIFLITLLMITPFFGHPDLLHSPLYSIVHLAALILGMLGFLIVWALAKFINKLKLKPWALPVSLTVFGLLTLICLNIFYPVIFSNIIDAFKTINIGLMPQQGEVAWRDFAREAIGEMRPMGIQRAFADFNYLLYLSLIALGLIIYTFIKKRKPEDILMVVWFLVIFLITGIVTQAFGQIRFSYYLSANISLLGGFLAVKGIGFAVSGWRISKDSLHKNYLRLGSILLVFNIIFFVFSPFPFNLIDSFPNNLPKIINGAMQTGIFGIIQRQQDWYETLEWLKESTPDPGLDYYAYYQEPGFNQETGKIDPYIYPETAYGILATWDVGHMITYYSHRLPIANPFQEGLGRIEDGEIIEPGETTFFIENDEKKATEMLEALKTKYVITDSGSAEAQGGFRVKPLWATGKITDYYSEEGENKGTPTEKYYQSMLVRLHYFDGENLDHFRLVYESKTTFTPSVFSQKENDFKNEVKMVKIFEYVKGATIRGNAPNGALVELSTEIKTNQNREFVYEKSAEVKDGGFEFVVPYSTGEKDSWLENGTKFEVFAGPYKIKIEGVEAEKEVNISEEDVLNENTIEI